MNHSRIGGIALRRLGLFGAVLLGAFAVYGGPALAVQPDGPPGNNGTVKIHEGADENQNGEVRNEPHVCTFHLHFYFADPEQAGAWEIQEWAPTRTKGTTVKSGTYDTHGDGEDRQPATGVYELDPGHYKLFWDGDTNKHEKMKVFWVECEETVGGGGGGGGGGGTGGGGTGGDTGGEELGGGGGAGGGEVLGETGTGGVQGVTATPPATDTANAASEIQTSNGWLPILVALGALVVGTMLLTPAPARLTNPQRSRKK